jgi:hypothetical protein
MELSCGIVVDLVADWVYGGWEVHIFVCRHVFLLAEHRICDIIYKQEAAMQSDTLESRSTRDILVRDSHFVT